MLKKNPNHIHRNISLERSKTSWQQYLRKGWNNSFCHACKHHVEDGYKLDLHYIALSTAESSLCCISRPTPQSSLLSIYLWPSWFWLAWVAAQLWLCLGKHRRLPSSPRQLLTAVFYISLHLLTYGPSIGLT